MVHEFGSGILVELIGIGEDGDISTEITRR